MRKTFIPIGLGMLIALGAVLPNESYAQSRKKSKSESIAATSDSISTNKKVEKDQNLMQNASSATTPRQINIGIPPGGDIQILENDVPVIFQFYPQIVTSVWKYDASIGGIGLLSLAEGALTYGKVGFSVTSNDREAGSKFKGFFSAYTNSWGNLTYSGNISGPIGKKGWGYVLGIHETYASRNGMNRMYSRYSDERAEMFKAGISKRYKDGSVKLLYKHWEEISDINNYYPLIYNGKGSFSPYPGFKLGQDSYTVGNGDVGYADANTGQSVKMNLGDDKYNRNISDALYLYGDHKFGNGFRLKYSSMYMHSKSPFLIQFPLTLGVTSANSTNQFNLHESGAAYTGDVQMVANQMVEPTKIDQSLTRIELTKKIDQHNLRLGLTEQYYATGLQKSDYSVYYQTVTPNPQLVDWSRNVSPNPAYPFFMKITDVNGVLGVAGDMTKIKTNKAALYFSDDFSAGKIFDFSVGARIEKEDDQELHNPYANSFIMDKPLMTVDFKNKWNHVLVGSFVAKLTHDFGFLGDVTYNDYLNRYYDYPASGKDANGNPFVDAYGQPARDANGNQLSQTTDAKSNQIKVIFLGAGVYYNHGDKFSIVSKVTRSSKINAVTALDIFDPSNAASKTHVYPLFYDIQTLGWTTDIMTSPFKNFNLHLLLTLQNPQYKNYSVSAYGQTYSYNNKVVPALSKVLMEIDPSYKLGSFRLFADLRYFGKQYGNLPNSIYYKPWWENFAGVEYRMSRNCDMKLQVVNFLNQTGISGSMQGADQITAATEPSYIGKTINASCIRPRTVEFTVNLKL